MSDIFYILAKKIVKANTVHRSFRNACILLNSDEGEHDNKNSNENIVRILQVNVKTIERLKQQICS